MTNVAHRGCLHLALKCISVIRTQAGIYLADHLCLDFITASTTGSKGPVYSYYVSWSPDKHQICVIKASLEKKNISRTNIHVRASCWDWQDNLVLACCHQNNHHILHRWCIFCYVLVWDTSGHINMWSNASQTTSASGWSDWITMRLCGYLHLPKTT